MLDSTQVSLVNFASLMRFFQFVTYGRFFSSIFVCSLHQRRRRRKMYRWRRSGRYSRRRSGRRFTFNNKLVFMKFIELFVCPANLLKITLGLHVEGLSNYARIAGSQEVRSFVSRPILYIVFIKVVRRVYDVMLTKLWRWSKRALDTFIIWWGVSAARTDHQNGKKQ